MKSTLNPHMHIRSSRVLLIGICSALLLMMLPTILIASPKTHYGIKSGIGLANMYGRGTQNSNMDPIKKFLFGGFVIHEINNDFAIQAELLFTNKGATREYTVPVFQGSLQFTETIVIRSLELPLIAKFPFPIKRKIKPSIYFGLNMTFSISDNVQGSYEVSGSNNFQDDSFSGKIGNVRKLGWEMIIGGDLTFQAGKELLVLDIRYNIGPSGVFKDIDDIASVPEESIPIADISTGKALVLKHSVILVTLGIQF